MLAKGCDNLDKLTHWPGGLLEAYKKMPALCDPIFTFGTLMGPVVQDFPREHDHLCYLTLRCLFIGLLLGVSADNLRSLSGLKGRPKRPFYAEYSRVGCTRFDNHQIAFSQLTVTTSGFDFLAEHLLLPPRPAIIPPWLHSLACVPFLWVRFNARPESASLCVSSMALVVCPCAATAQLPLICAC